MKDRAIVTYDPGELAAFEAGGFYPLDLPHDASGIDVMILHTDGPRGHKDDMLIAVYDVRRIPVDGSRVLSRKLKVLAVEGKRHLDVTLFPRHAVVERAEQ